MKKERLEISIGCGETIWSLVKGLIALIVVAVIAIMVLFHFIFGV